MSIGTWYCSFINLLIGYVIMIVVAEGDYSCDTAPEKLLQAVGHRPSFGNYFISVFHRTKNAIVNKLRFCSGTNFKKGVWVIAVIEIERVEKSQKNWIPSQISAPKFPRTGPIWVLSSSEENTWSTEYFKTRTKCVFWLEPKIWSHKWCFVEANFDVVSFEVLFFFYHYSIFDCVRCYAKTIWMIKIKRNRENE